MLIKLICDAIFTAVTGFISFIPEIPVPIEASEGIGYVFNLAGTLGFILPLGTIATVFTVIILVYGIKFFISVTSYTARKIPTIS